MCMGKTNHFCFTYKILCGTLNNSDYEQLFSCVHILPLVEFDETLFPSSQWLESVLPSPPPPLNGIEINRTCEQPLSSFTVEREYKIGLSSVVRGPRKELLVHFGFTCTFYLKISISLQIQRITLPHHLPWNKATPITGNTDSALYCSTFNTLSVCFCQFQKVVLDVNQAQDWFLYLINLEK